MRPERVQIPGGGALLGRDGLVGLLPEDKVIIVSDHTKFGRGALIPLAALDAVVSDTGLDVHHQEWLRAHDIDVRLAYSPAPTLRVWTQAPSSASVVALEVCAMAKVVVSLLSEDQEFQQMQAEDARATAGRLGLEVAVLFAENNAILQIQQLYRFVHAAESERPAGIIVEAVAEAGLARVARNAARAGVGWVGLSGTAGDLGDLRREYPSLVISSVLADEVEIGRIQGRQARALLPSGGVLLSVEGPPDTPAAQGRRHGLAEEIKGTGLEVGGSLHGDWTERSGDKAISSWLRLKTSEAFVPSLVVCQNDAMAVGARRAMRTLRPDWAGVPLTGCDGLPAGGRQLVAKNELVATIVKPTTTGPAVELLARALGGGSAPPSLVLKPSSWPPEEDLGALRSSS